MRKENKRNNETVQAARVQGYHEGGRGSESYAFTGFDGENAYFNSDRKEKLDENFKRLSGKPCRAIGIEIEVESWGFNTEKAFATVLKQVIFKLFPEGLFKMQHDGSLGGGGSIGIECITQLMTKEFIRNHYRDFKTMFNDYFPIFDISATRSGNCGMHVNISNALFNGDDNIRKFYYIVNRHYDFIAALVNRTGSTYYCRRMSHDKDYCKTLDLHYMSASHSNCFNGSHYDAGRIELRLVGGQENFACFRNTMESIFFLIERVKKLSWNDCDDLVKIFSGCNQYVFDRIATKCYERGTISSADVAAIRSKVERDDTLI